MKGQCPNPSQCYDYNAERFRGETHLMAPAKSQPLEIPDNDEERRAAWDKWLPEGKYECIALDI